MIGGRQIFRDAIVHVCWQYAWNYSCRQSISKKEKTPQRAVCTVQDRSSDPVGMSRMTKKFASVCTSGQRTIAPPAQPGRYTVTLRLTCYACRVASGASLSAVVAPRAGDTCPAEAMPEQARRLTVHCVETGLLWLAVVVDHTEETAAAPDRAGQE